jgi:hypothetical protein
LVATPGADRPDPFRGGGPARIFTNNANYSAFGGSNPNNGTFGGNGANNLLPLSSRPRFNPGH